ncbi:hypothetical protein HRbin17_01559 [bacterium HR17]|uniref:Uncharacterized protein n=1 Tax=Candidatus Fervidibacter japonicus TaxID=2035412 RepID=A0A2H5XCW7_9BACT|nr:hypothetical protein HRbin17_01559 [bacterium HR17]
MQPVTVAPQRATQPLHGLSFRALALGALFSVGAVLIVSYAELVVKEIQIAICQFNPAALGLLAVLVALNGVVSWGLRRPFLRPHEVLIVYTMTVLAAMIASRGLMEKLLPALVAVNYFANPQNRWAESFFPHIPRWLVPFDPTGLERQPVARYFYEGSKGVVIWSEWLTPLAAWATVVAGVWMCFLAIAVVWRRQWADHEKLNFPLTQPPLQLIDPTNRAHLWRNRLAWLGFGFSAFVFFVNGLNRLYPVVPQIRVAWTLNDYLTERPFNAIFFTPVYTSYAAIGFAYFLPTQLLFSLWFFFWLTRLQDIVLAWLGYEHMMVNMPLYPTRLYIGYQVLGAYLVLVWFFWRAALPYLKQVVAKVLGRNTLDDRNELMSYRAAVLLGAAGLLIAVGWGIAAGLSPMIAVVEFGVYLGVVVLVMARSVAEGGLMMTETSFRPIDLMRLFVPKHQLGARPLTVLGFTDAVFTRDLRGLLVTPLLDSLKMSEQVHLSRRALLLPAVAAMVIGFVTAAVYQLKLPYTHGALTMYWYAYQGNPRWAFEDHIGAIVGQDNPPGYIRGFFLVGVVLTYGMVVARSHFWWFPLHPLAYALSASWTLIVFWFPIFVAWLIKSLILRYAGVRAFHRYTPFFVGLIYGEFFTAVLWAVHAWLTRKPAPFFPWP